MKQDSAAPALCHNFVSNRVPVLQDVLNKAKDAAEAAVGHAKEGLSKAFSSAKDMVSGFTSKDGKAEEL